jgi:ribonuclease VapC
LSGIYIDSSALLALLKDEPGADRVAQILDGAFMTAINFAEVVSVYARSSVKEATVLAILRPFNLEVVPVDKGLAFRAGMLAELTKPAGLSLGDRVAIAAALRDDADIYTADKAWLSVQEHHPARIHLIR